MSYDPTYRGARRVTDAPIPTDLIELAEWQLEHFDAVHTHTAERMVAELKRLTPPTEER